MQTKREEIRMIWNGTESSIFQDTKKIVCFTGNYTFICINIYCYIFRAGHKNIQRQLSRSRLRFT